MNWASRGVERHAEQDTQVGPCCVKRGAEANRFHLLREEVGSSAYIETGIQIVLMKALFGRYGRLFQQWQLRVQIV